LIRFYSNFNFPFFLNQWTQFSSCGAYIWPNHGRGNRIIIKKL